jgi:hypothetical protein
MKYKWDFTGGLWRVYEEPKPTHFYVVSGDSATGLPGRNGSGSHIIDCNTRSVVAVLDANIAPEILAWEMEQAGYFYNVAMLAPETYATGILVVYKLYDAKYPNIFKHEGQFLSDGGAPSASYGWKPTENNRNLCLSLLQADVAESASKDEFLRNRALKIPDLPTIDQMNHFVRNAKGKVEAAYGHCDDLVMSLAIGNAVSRQIEKTIPKPQDKKPKTIWEQWSGSRPKGGIDGKFDFYNEPLFAPYEGINERTR